MALEFSENTRKKLTETSERLPDKHSLLIPALAMAQEDFGYVSTEAMELIASELGVTIAEVKAVATFYTMFNKKPVGRYHIQVCQNLTCSILGAEPLISYLEKKLGISCGETSKDKMFTLSRVECLGACGTAPVMQINDDYYENLTTQKIDEILATLKEAKKE
jgi:NADH-quinone oxidoreductase subunit E